MLDPKARPELLTPAEMSEADRFAVAAGTPGIALMERAGLAVADEAARLAKSGGRIVVLCGPGGNGGDGFIAGRLLAKRGYPVELGLIGRREALRGDPALAASRYEGQVLDAAAIDPGGADRVIDAVFGAGLARDIDGPAKVIIERVNTFAGAGGRVVAVDVPSGVDGEPARFAASRSRRARASPSSASNRATCCCRAHARRAIRLADIGIPEAALARIAPQAFVNAPAVWREALPHVGAESDKYARGAVLSCGARRIGPAPPARRPRCAALGRRHRHSGQPARCGRGTPPT